MRCEKGEWTLVASNVRKGFIWTGLIDPVHVLGAYVAAGGDAPTEQNDATVGEYGSYFEIKSQTEIDVYLFPVEKTLEDAKISV